jgi:CBS domain-containing protein
MKVKDLMTSSVVSLNSNDSTKKAAELMKEHNIGSVPVCQDGKVIGIVTDRDIALRTVGDGKDAKTVTVRDIMCSNPVLGTPDMSIDEASRIMSDRQIRRLPVVDNNNLVGILALGDIAVQPRLNENAERALSSISESNTPEY